MQRSYGPKGLLFLSLGLVLAPFCAALAAKSTTLQGEVEVIVIDGEKTTEYRHYLKTPEGKRYRLRHRDSKALMALRPRSKIRARGALTTTDLTVEDSPTSRVSSAATSSLGGIELVAEAPAADILGTRRVLVILANFQDNKSTPYTSASVRPIYDQVIAFYQENSYGALSIAVDIVGWYTLPVPESSTCDGNAALETANNYAVPAAAAAGVNLSQYQHGAIVYPPSNCRGYTGMGYVEGSLHVLNGLNGTIRTPGHELAHNFGLWHAHALQCGSSALSASCETTVGAFIEYGHPYDIMGTAGVIGHFTGPEKQYLGWTMPTTVSASGDYVITPMSVPGGVKSLKIPTTSNRSYYIEMRKNTGFDNGITDPRVLGGVLLHWAPSSVLSSTDRNTFFALDATPGDSNWSNLAVAAGETFVDPFQGFQITPISVTATQAVVRVNLTPSSGSPLIQLTKSAMPSTGSSGSVVTFSILYQNTGTATANTVELSDSIPTGTTLVPGSITAGGSASGGTVRWTIASIAAGASGTVSFQVTIN